MAVLNVKKFHNGFTLIEVLVALAILSIALTAIIKTTAQNIKDTRYLQDKQIATWIGTEALNEARAGFIKLPETPDHLDDEKKTLGQSWKVSTYSAATANDLIKEIHVDVYRQTDETKLISLVSYLYVAP